MARAAGACAGADLLLCVGSSLEVFPVAGLPELTLQGGGRIAIVTKGSDPLRRRGVDSPRRGRGRRADRGSRGARLSPGSVRAERLAAAQDALGDPQRLGELVRPARPPRSPRSAASAAARWRLAAVTQRRRGRTPGPGRHGRGARPAAPRARRGAAAPPRAVVPGRGRRGPAAGAARRRRSARGRRVPRRAAPGGEAPRLAARAERVGGTSIASSQRPSASPSPVPKPILTTAAPGGRSRARTGPGSRSGAPGAARLIVPRASVITSSAASALRPAARGSPGAPRGRSPPARSR